MSLEDRRARKPLRENWPTSVTTYLIISSQSAQGEPSEALIAVLITCPQTSDVTMRRNGCEASRKMDTSEIRMEELHFRRERVIDFRAAYIRGFYRPFVTVERPEMICISPRCEIHRKRSSFRSAGVRINLSARREHQIPLRWC